MQIEFNPLAVKEVLKSQRRYRKRSPRTAERFLLALDTAIDEIKARPDYWPEHLLGTRFRRLRRFPYYV